MIEILIFGAKAFLIVAATAAILILIALLAARASNKNELEVEPLHEKYKNLGLFLKSFVATKDEKKEEKKKLKTEKKENKSKVPEKRVFVLNFDGDIKASQVESLREEITALIQTATSKDEVVVKVESPGGEVHGYGLAASQLLRVRERNIPLTICVDKVAASGGYMMACVAHKVLGAPFAIVGSIGVVAQVPNFHRVLKKHDVDYKEYTAGEYKRTVSLLGEITPKGEEKFVERLNDTHVLFKRFVQNYRPQLDLAKVATGEYWFGQEAKDLGLIDAIQTSDDYLLSFGKDTPIFELKFKIKQGLSEKLSGVLGRAIAVPLEKLWNRAFESRFF